MKLQETDATVNKIKYNLLKVYLETEPTGTEWNCQSKNQETEELIVLISYFESLQRFPEPEGLLIMFKVILRINTNSAVDLQNQYNLSYGR